MVSKTPGKATGKSGPRVRGGFYGRALDEAERLDLQEASEVSGLDDEVAVLRLLLRRLIQEQPGEIKLQLDTINTLAKLLHTRYQLSAEQKNSLKEAILKVLTEVAIPLGIKFIPGAPN